MLTFVLRITAALALAGGVLPHTALADSPGEELYLTYCASCHGAQADGNGPMNDVLTMKVPDLTTITQRNDGNFPFLKVVHMVDGRSGVMAHGSEMPVWGDQFAEQFEREKSNGMKGDLSTIYKVRGRVLSLVYYLESIQK
ncbi:c-type cytochrome [Aliiroseovarius sp. KMU-50]|uniref:C-type cytochrome n=1 Tax=Aliiroseovarius salicola TaxID=3009082 RepID=A0ABT4W0A6_9RHOB|nr:c-type cytochrome [Aliiroseovarius sp. KMU-50]MDA5093906.1 c-type cytochrome [Aliiroseovarius sp. KMU-50]